MISLLLFASAREAAGRARDTFDEAGLPTIDALLAVARKRYGADFEAILETSRIWLNGDEPPEGLQSSLRNNDEVAILPPVSGGC